MPNNALYNAIINAPAYNGSAKQNTQSQEQTNNGLLSRDEFHEQYARARYSGLSQDDAVAQIKAGKRFDTWQPEQQDYSSVYEGKGKIRNAGTRLWSSYLGGVGDLISGTITGAAKAVEAGSNAIANIPVSDKDRSVYQIARGKSFYDTDYSGAGKSAITQADWDALDTQTKNYLSGRLKIKSLDEFNAALGKAYADMTKANAKADVNAQRVEAARQAGAPFREAAEQYKEKSVYGLENDWARTGVEAIGSAPGQIVDAAIGALTGGSALPFMALRAFGNAYDNYIAQGKSEDKATAAALGSAAIEWITEKIGGETILGGLAMGRGKGLLDDAIDNSIAKVGTKWLQPILKYAYGAGSEALEEVISQGAEPFVDALLEEDYGKALIENLSDKWSDPAAAAKELLLAGFGGAIMAVVGNAAIDVGTGTINALKGNGFQTATGQQINRINAVHNLEQSPEAATAYTSAKDAGKSEGEAILAGNNVLYDQGKQREYDKLVSDYIMGHNALSDTEQQSRRDAFAEIKDEFNGVKRGFVLVDADGNEVGRVVHTPSNGCVVRFADGSFEAMFNSPSSGSIDRAGLTYKTLSQGGEFVNNEVFDAVAEQIAKEEAMKAKRPVEEFEPQQPPKDYPAPKAAPMPEGEMAKPPVTPPPAPAPAAPTATETQKETEAKKEQPKLDKVPQTVPSKYPVNKNTDGNYLGMPVRIKPNKDGTIVVRAAEPRKKGSGYKKSYEIIGIAHSDDEANQMIVAHYKKSKQKLNAVADATAGTKISQKPFTDNTSKIAPESPQNAPKNEGTSIRDNTSNKRTEESRELVKPKRSTVKDARNSVMKVGNTEVRFKPAGNGQYFVVADGAAVYAGEKPWRVSEDADVKEVLKSVVWETREVTNKAAEDEYNASKLKDKNGRLTSDAKQVLKIAPYLSDKDLSMFNSLYAGLANADKNFKDAYAAINSEVKRRRNNPSNFRFKEDLPSADDFHDSEGKLTLTPDVEKLKALSDSELKALFEEYKETQDSDDLNTIEKYENAAGIVWKERYTRSKAKLKAKQTAKEIAKPISGGITRAEANKKVQEWEAIAKRAEVKLTDEDEFALRMGYFSPKLKRIFTDTNNLLTKEAISNLPLSVITARLQNYARGAKISSDWFNLPTRILENLLWNADTQGKDLRRETNQYDSGADVAYIPKGGVDRIKVKKIDSFRGDYQFLSNMADAKVMYDGMEFPSAEAAFQAAKLKDKERRKRFQHLSGKEAKKLGHQVPLGKDWDDIKTTVMRDVLLSKFGDNPELRAKLLATKDYELIEGNTWGDTYWGVSDGEGENMLGQILMDVRDELRSNPVSAFPEDRTDEILDLVNRLAEREYNQYADSFDKDRKQTKDSKKAPDERERKVERYTETGIEDTVGEDEDEKSKHKYKDAELGYDFTPDNPYEDNEDAYDWTKVSAYMAENNEKNALERLNVLRRAFPDKEFRISDDSGHIEEVYGHATAKSEKAEDSSWWSQHGWSAINNRWNEMGADRKSVFSERSLVPVTNKKGIPNYSVSDFTDKGVKGNREKVQFAVINGLQYYFRIGNGIYRHIIDSDISKGVNRVITWHEDLVDALKERINDLETAIKNGERYIKKGNQLFVVVDTLSRIKGQERMSDYQYFQKLQDKVDALKERLEKEQDWLWRLDGTDKKTYTLANFLSESKEKDSIFTPEERNAVMKYIAGKGEAQKVQGISFNADDHTFDDFKFKALRNALSKECAEEIVNELFKGGYHGFNARGNDGNLTPLQRSKRDSGFQLGYLSARDTESKTGRDTDAYRNEYGNQPESITGLSAYDQPAQRNAVQSGRTGAGAVVDDSGTVRQVYGEQGENRSGNRSSRFAKRVERNAARVTEDINQLNEADVVLHPKGGKQGATVTAKQIDSDTYIEGEAVGQINPDNVDERFKPVASDILEAAKYFGVSAVQINGRFIRTHTDENGNYYTTNPSAMTDLNDGYIAISEINKDNVKEVVLDSTHEITHIVSTLLFGDDDAKKIAFAKGIGNKARVRTKDDTLAKIDIEAKCKKIAAIYAPDGKSFTGAVAEEFISRIAEGDTCGENMFTRAEVEALQEVLLSTPEFKEMMGRSEAYKNLLEFSRTQARNTFDLELNKNKPGTDVGMDTATQPADAEIDRLLQQIKNLVTGKRSNSQETTLEDTETTKSPMAQMYRNVSEEAQAEPLSAEEKQQLKKERHEAEGWDYNNINTEQAKRDFKEGQKRFKEDLSDEAPEAGETISWAQHQADISKGKISADEFQEIYETVNDMYNNDEAHAVEKWPEPPPHVDEDTWESKWDERNKDAKSPDAMKATQENPFAVKEYGGGTKTYGNIENARKTIQKIAERTAFRTNGLAEKLLGHNPNAVRTAEQFRALNNLMGHVMTGKKSFTSLYHMLENYHGSTGIGQFVDDYTLRLFQTAAQLEQDAYDADGHITDGAPAYAYLYAADKALTKLAAKAQIVQRVEYDRKVNLIKSAEKNGTGGAKNLAHAGAQWVNSMQMSGENFWRMQDGYNAEGNGAGYDMAARHTSCVATKIQTMARALGFFENVKHTKGFREFANGKAKGKYGSLLTEVSLKKSLDTLYRERKVYNESGKLIGTEPDWTRAFLRDHFTVTDVDGKTTEIKIEGKTLKDRSAWLTKFRNELANDIESNDAAREYTKALEDMFAYMSPMLQKTSSNLGFIRPMSKDGRYFPLSNADFVKSKKAEFGWSLEDEMGTGISGFKNMKKRYSDTYNLQIMPASKVVDAYIQQATNYIAFAEFGEELKVLIDDKGAFGSYGDVVNDKFGESYARWLKNYAKDINMIKDPDPTGLRKLLSKSRSLMMQGALLGSVSVPIKQTASYWSAMGVIDPVALGRAWRGPLRSGEVGKITNLFYLSRKQGSIDPDVSHALQKGWVERLRNSSKVGAFIANATNIMDSRTVANVYLACVYDIERNSGLTKAQMYQNGKNVKGGLKGAAQLLVDAKFAEAVMNTQPIFTKQARPELSRTNDEFLKMFSTFRTQQMQNYNRLLKTFNEANAAKKLDPKSANTEAAKKEFRQTVAGQVAAAASISALSMIADIVLHKHWKYKDDDDDEKWDAGKIFETLGIKSAEAMAGTTLFGNELAQILIDNISKGNTKEFNGISAGAVSSAIGAIQSWGWLRSNYEKYGDKYLAANIKTAVTRTSTLLGIPLSNAYNLMNAFYQLAGDIAGKDILSGYDNSKYDDFMKEWDRHRTDYGNKLYNAVKAGDSTKAEKAVEQMGDKFESTIWYTCREHLKNGEMDDDEVVNTLMMYGGKDESDAEYAVQTMHLQIDTGYSSLTSDSETSAKMAYIEGDLSKEDYKNLLIEYGSKNSETADQAIANIDVVQATGYKENKKTTSDLYSTYDQKAKMGVTEFYQKYSDRFETPEKFGEVFNYLNNSGRSKFPEYKSLMGNNEATANQRRAITLLNELLKQKKIDYNMARLIWTQHYGYKTNSYSQWHNVKAA